MKKLLLISFLAIYAAVSTGFVVNMHYCMNRFHSWELGTAAEDQCGQCGMSKEKKSGCCHDEVKVVKLQQDLVKAQGIDFIFSLAEALPVTFFSPEIVCYTEQKPGLYVLPHGPPRPDDLPIYLQNRVFRI